ncbi:MAG: thioredoxin [Candidatus Nitrosotenuis sp.]|uniref:Thioredoxin n=1 Tax=Candidatus Nitrosotenuis uzonensis TaxID=1407055 RepID=A0A812F0U6_9ARCH|nr:thioredoxin [Candidatus Nitrosotenuis uzonensis]CAE6493451.1 Thioredoxin [Candidatus Nitrosotenuis uzonensis]
MEDPEIEKIKQRKLEEMLRQQQENTAQSQVEVVDLDSSNFDHVVSSNNLVLVDFWAEWCGPCRMMHPVFTRMAKKYRHIKFARVNVDNSQDIAIRFGVQSIPTFIMFRAGQAVDRMIGAVGEPGIHMIAQKYQM